MDRPALPGQPAHAAAEGEATDAGVADQPGRHGEPVGLGGGVDVAEQRAALHAGAAGPRGRRSTRFSRRRSIITPPSHMECPGMLCAPPRTAISNPSVRANRTAAATSAAEMQSTITAGRRSMAAFHTFRASS